MLKFLYELFKIIFIIVFPFIVLIRVSVYLHEKYALTASLALLSGVFLSALIIFFYTTIIHGKLLGKTGSHRGIKRRFWFAFILVAGYVMHGIFYLSDKNFRNPEIRSEILEVHPVLRLGVSTIIHLDKDLLITDAGRLPEDYRRMGLKKKSHSLHYKQNNGYTHALDIHTSSRHPLRNTLLKYYFKTMGFNTLRHSGAGTTGDHLHISLKSHDRPSAI